MVDPRKIWSSSQLPTLPSVAIRLLEISRDPNVKIKDVVEIIKADPAISAKILKATNSSFFGLKSEIASIDRAVPLLGTTVITSLALSFSLVESAMTSGAMAEHYNTYWTQSVVQGITAEVFGNDSTKKQECDFFLSGLLVDLGRLAMLKTIPREYLPVLQKTRKEHRDLHEVEAEMLGVDHIEVGMKLVDHWKLPKALISAIEHHHASLPQIRERKDAPDFELIKAVSVSAAVGEYFCSGNKGRALKRLRDRAEEFYGFSESELNDLLVRIKDQADERGKLYFSNADELADPSDLMAEASEQLAQLAMREHVANTKAAAQHEAVQREKQELETKNEKLQIQALRDPLTKIYNRLFFDEALQKEIDRCRRSATPVGVIFCDIDRFKQLNDNHGHQFGDLVLQRIATTFTNVLRDSDLVARYGGEEFVVLVTEPSENGLAKVAERIRAGVEAEDFDVDTKPIPVTVSVGAVLAIPKKSRHNDLAKQLIAAADEAMYDSKQNGRNQVHVRSLMDENERLLLSEISSNLFSRWLVNRQVFDVPTVSTILLKCRTAHRHIGDLALHEQYLSTEQIDRVLQERVSQGERFGETAVRLGMLSVLQVAHLLAMQREDPVLLSQEFVRAGMLDQQRAVTLLSEYIDEMKANVTAQQTAPV